MFISPRKISNASSGSLVTAVRVKAYKNFRMAAMMLYIPKKKYFNGSYVTYFNDY
jgi:hypothetical protein